MRSRKSWAILALFSTFFAGPSAGRPADCPNNCDCVPDPVIPTAELLICHYAQSHPPTLPLSTVYASHKNLRSLFITCDDDVGLPEFLLKGLASLHHLKIEKCPLSHFAAKFFEDLPNVRWIEMDNMSPSGKLLELTEDVLLPLARLEKFALTGNKGLILPPRMLCTLSHLQVLNVSSNELTSLPRDPNCIAQQLIIIDASFNKLEAVDDFIAGAPAVRQLSLAHNSIEFLALGDSTPFMQQLDVEANKILGVVNKLPETLVHVNLARNKLADIPEAVYELAHLISLNVSGNTISGQNASAFETPELESLDASHNQLASLPTEWLKNTEASIVHLRLHDNNIEAIPPRSFANATSLQTLDVSSNRIHVLQDESLSGASRLNSLALKNNSLEVVEPMALAELQLESLDLSRNSFTEVPAAVGRLAKVKRVDLSRNKISKLYQFVLNKLNNLHSIDLSHNELQSIGPFVFSDSAELTSLDLANNHISLLFKDAFAKCPKLRKLSLKYNRLKSLDDGLAQAAGVKRLDLSNNELSVLQWSTLPPNVEHLIADENNIALLGAVSGSKLKTVSLVGNVIAQLSADQLPNSIESLDLTANQIRHIAKGTFAAKSSLRRVALESNKLTAIEATSLRVNEAVHPLRVTLAKNPLQCSCEMTWIVGAAVGNVPDKLVRVVVEDRANATCRHSVDDRVLKLDELSKNDMLCPYAQVCEPECVCCQYGNCDCKSICPAACRCFRDATFAINIVRCDANHTETPRREFVVSEVPVYATDIVLSGVALPQLRTHAFIGRLRLQNLRINGTGLRSIQPKAFHTLPALKTLDLSDNALSSLSGDEFMKTTDVVQLFLNGNRLSSLSRGIFEKMPSLQFITLHNNSFEDVPEVLSQVASLRSISLAGNPLRCDCYTNANAEEGVAGDSQPFARMGRRSLETSSSSHNAAAWMHAHRALVHDAALVECVENVTRAFRDNDTTVLSAYPPNRDHDVFVMSMDEFLRDYNVSICVPFSSGFFGQDPQNSVLFIVFILACAFLVCAVGLLGLSMARKTHNAISQRRYKTSSLNCSTTAGSSPLPLPLISYHAFVSYSKKDEKMVVDELCRPLEDEDYQLCLLHRDGPAYNSMVHSISDELIAQMDSSQCLIIVLTRNFLENEWRTLQIKTSHQLFAKNRSKRLIAVLGEGVDANLIDDELGQILRKNTCIGMRDHLFWTLLQSALPARIPPPPGSDTSQVYSDVYGIVPSAMV
ncbi:unnamed protein product [Caenorhabditis auriculariae]|uniref:TIR domain-containing protein n=1 Tax=Caenorhabditis auriculariae TaxID=2777116 RepID=A0A8S1HR43_9PELO|nr:unnamed protein product [Caenorhabditis auriculariae]